ncbi:hypothetical protein [Streptomyces mirabilis]|uniref:hypothetical protein n=1 Tax=Streptomyces mirabilis TaxID=68239 RepID=UPI00364F2EC7
MNSPEAYLKAYLEAADHAEIYIPHGYPEQRPEGRAGLPLVELWMSVVNPYRLMSPSRVYSPDFKIPRVQHRP